MVRISRSRYAAIYGPTTGDQVRLGDTDLWIEIEEDRTVGGEEAIFGGGKSIRESMAQSTVSRAGGALDTVITNAIILDWWGVIRADIGIRDGLIVGIGHAGNPDISDGIDMIIGPSTDVVSGEGRIVTAGAIDSHVHLISPVADPRGARDRSHHGHRRRHRTLRGIQGHDRHAGRLASEEHAAVPRHAAGEHPPARQRQHGVCRGAARAGARRCRRLQGARRLGIDAGCHRRSAAGRRRLGSPGGPALRLAQRGRIRRFDHPRHRWALDPRVPRRGSWGRSRARHPHDREPAAHHPGFDEPHIAAHREHGRGAPRHAHGLPSPEPGGPRGPRLRRVPHSRDHDRRRGHPARPWGPLDYFLRLAGDGTHRRGRYPHLAGRPRDEAAAAAPWASRSQRTTSVPVATLRSTRSTRPLPTVSPATSARWRWASSPTS